MFAEKPAMPVTKVGEWEMEVEGLYLGDMCGLGSFCNITRIISKFAIYTYSSAT